MKRENRYTVLKNKDIAAYLTADEQAHLDDLCRKINRSRLIAGKQIVQCVVVEHDWPEYEIVWEMITKRVDNPIAKTCMNCGTNCDQKDTRVCAGSGNRSKWSLEISARQGKEQQ